MITEAMDHRANLHSGRQVARFPLSDDPRKMTWVDGTVQAPRPKTRSNPCTGHRSDLGIEDLEWKFVNITFTAGIANCEVEERWGFVKSNEGATVDSIDGAPYGGGYDGFCHPTCWRKRRLSVMQKCSNGGSESSFSCER